MQTNLVAIHRALRAAGHSALVANITRHRRASGDGVYYPKNALQLAWVLLRARADVIHLHIGGNLSTRLVLLCLFCTLLPRSKTVVTFHSGGYAGSAAGRSAGRRTLRGFVLRRVDVVVAVNQEIVDVLRRFGVDERRIACVAPHAVDPDEIAAAKRTPLPEPIAAFARVHAPLLLTVGLLEPEYDLPLQLAALPAIREPFPGAGLAIVGSGSLHDELRRRIEQSNVASHVLLCGDVSHDVTLRMIAQADALLRTTLYDGDSVAVREALYAGTPVIATDNGMRPPGVTRFPVGDGPALVNAAVAVLSGGSEAAPATADPGGVGPVLALYDKLVSGKPAAALSLANPR